MDHNRLRLVAASLIVAGAGVVVAQQAPPTPGAQGSTAQQGMDCPLARAPYSSQTPLIDLLVDPETKAVIDQQMGEVLAKLPPMLTSTQLPSFAAIITLKELAGFIGGQRSETQWARLDAELRAVPVTRAATLARCARYDQVPPSCPPPSNARRSWRSTRSRASVTRRRSTCGGSLEELGRTARMDRVLQQQRRNLQCARPRPIRCGGVEQHQR